MTNPHIGTSLDEWLAETFTPERIARIEAHAQQFIAEEWQRRANRMMRKKLRRASRIAPQPHIRTSVARSRERSLKENAPLWRDPAQY